jgi:uncharacterized delta-60 repeat protein
MPKGGIMKRFKLLLVFVSALSLLLPALLYSQSVNTVWVRIFNAPGNSDDYGQAIAVDDSGYVYVTGGASFTPWPDMDYATVKYNSNGDTVWLIRYDGPGDSTDNATALAIDKQGNVYVTGRSSGSGHPYDYATIKYNSLGDTVWVRRYNGPGNDEDKANAMAVDTLGNVYVTGWSDGSGSSADYATIKYNSIGETLWIRRYNGMANNGDAATALAIDRQGNVYVTGISNGSGTSEDYATIKYYANGDTAWVRRYDSGQDEACAIAVDDSGNVYVTGTSYGSGILWDYLTIRYNSNGDTAWVRKYNGSGNNNDDARAIKADNLGNVYVTGKSNGSSTDDDYVTIKYNSNGDTVWVRRYNGPGNGVDGANAMAIDDLGDIYVTGYSQTTSSSYENDFATVKYNSAGVQQWVARYNGGSWDQAHAIAVKGANIYVTGQSWTNALWSYDRVTIKYVQTLPGIESPIVNCKLKIDNLSVYPNPAKTYFTVRVPLNVQGSIMQIFDVTGKIVRSVELKGKNNRLSLDGIKNGVYFVKVNNEMMKKKLVVTR